MLRFNSNSIGNSRATGLSVEDCCVSPSLNEVDRLKRVFIVTHCKYNVQIVCYPDKRSFS